MKTLRKILVILIILTFVPFGCGRFGSDDFDPYEEYQKLPDTDGDGIADKHEKTGNENSCEVECERANGETLCLDCVVEDDCDCDFIPDGEDLDFIYDCLDEGCGKVDPDGDHIGEIFWGFMGLVGGMMVGSIIESKSKYAINVEDVDFEASYFKYEKDDGKKYMKVHVEGICSFTNKEKPQNFDCEADVRNQIDSWKDFESGSEIDDVNINELPYSDLCTEMKYSFNIDKSPIKVSNASQYMKLKLRNKEKIIKDPSVLGLKKTSSSEKNETQVEFLYLTNKDNPNAPTYFGAMSFEREDIETEEICYSLKEGSEPTDDNWLYDFEWGRVNCASMY